MKTQITNFLIIYGPIAFELKKCTICLKTNFIKYKRLIEDMIEPGNCYMCDRPVNNLFEGTARWYFGKEFCSQGCKNSHRGTIIGYSGAGVAVFGLILLAGSNNPAMISVFILGLALTVFGSYLKSDSKERKVGSARMVGNTRSSGGMPFDPQDKLIYSNILKTKVHPCCHQSARLNDQYCACGRAIEYPS